MMIHIRNTLGLLSLLVVFITGNVSFADDLLSILETSETESFVQEQTELSSALRKLLPSAKAEQNIFLGFLDKSEFEKALLQWNAAFRGSEFEKSPSGKALYAYLLFKNKLEVVGVETLFQVNSPEKIHHTLRRMWTLVAPREHKVWSFVTVKWQPEWTKVFDMDTELRVLSRQEIDPEKREEILALLKKTKVNTRARSWLQWQMALSLALNDDVGKAAKVLAYLLKDKSNLVSTDLIQITAARLLYERGYLDAALNYYDKISKSSEYWFVAQEEKAWTYLRKGQPQDTLAISQTLMTEELAPHVGPEMVFLTSLSQLKVCDYRGAANSIVAFRKRFQPRAKSLLALTENADVPDVQVLFDHLSKGRVKLLDLKAAAKTLPRYVSRDELLLSLVQSQYALEAEARFAGELYSRSLSEGSDKVGFQAAMEELKVAVNKRASFAKSAALSLLQRRAQEEVEEIQFNLQRMHIVEAELIQQTSLANRVVAATAERENNKKATINKPGKYDLKFPFVGEKWFDELSNYRIDINKACTAKKASR